MLTGGETVPPEETDSGESATESTSSGELAIDDATLSALPEDRNGGDRLDTGDVFEILKNRRRRRVIQFLKETDDGVATLDDLAEHIAAKENDIDISQISSSQRKRVYIGLYQCHLPKMDKFGVINYRKRRGIIELQEVPQLERYLGEPNTRLDGRSAVAAAVTVSAVVVVGLSGVGPLSAVPTAGWTIPCIAALLWLAFTDRSQFGRPAREE